MKERGVEKLERRKEDVNKIQVTESNRKWGNNHICNGVGKTKRSTLNIHIIAKKERKCLAKEKDGRRRRVDEKWIN